MSYTITNRWTGKPLYVAESAADVREALEEAVKRGANLSDANLSDANLSGFRDDLWAVLDQAPAEVQGVRNALVEGRVNGTVYKGKCACLVGTIANVRGCRLHQLDIGANASRPAEQWFLPIAEGDKPGDKSEGGFRSEKAVEWIDEWFISRRHIAEVLATEGEYR